MAVETRACITTIILCLATLVAAQEPATPGNITIKITAAEAKKLMIDATGDDAKKAEAARAKLETVRPEDHGLLFAALEEVPFREPKAMKSVKKTVHRMEFDIGLEGKKGLAIYQFPDKREPKKPMPVIFRLHGSGDTAEKYRSNTHDPGYSRYLTVTPEIPSPERTGWNEPGGFNLIDAAYRALLENFDVDTDRIFITGYSAGGGASFLLAESWPHRFAGLFSAGRAAHCFHLQPKACMDTLRHVPGYYLVGAIDQQDRVDGYKEAEAYFKEAGLPGTFVFVPGMGHTYPGDWVPKALEMFKKLERVRYPKEFKAMFYVYNNDSRAADVDRRQYWLEADADARGTTPHVKVSGNVIDIDAEYFTKGRVYLNDKIVDLDKPVRVQCRGRVVHESTVERKVAFLLESYLSRRDRGQLYWNAIDIQGS